MAGLKIGPLGSGATGSFGVPKGGIKPAKGPSIKSPKGAGIKPLRGPVAPHAPLTPRMPSGTPGLPTGRPSGRPTKVAGF